ncbi:hypothetical protein PLESTF_001600900 [Pleodorina starrii]|nr:hypothetical protein PLESTM_000534200 [Pleodorina starrii]GLC75153.1 hypothetical protein PLESTF_001600900 [Pleodorina starrii]
MCELLGFKYGRSYFTQEVAYPSKKRYTNSAIVFGCEAKSRPSAGHRRQLRGDASATALALSAGADTHLDDPHSLATAATADASGQGNHVRARLLSYFPFSSSTPKAAPYDCRFYPGNCHWNGPLAGVECSNQPLPPAPSPPPSPPSPPPYEASIRIIGGHDPPTTGGPLEPNLCPADAPQGFCQMHARVELLVGAPEGDKAINGQKIWAPLCAVSEGLQYTVATIACQQAYGWPSLWPILPIFVFGRPPAVPPDSFVVPTGPVTQAGDFDPASYQGWATLTGLKDVQPSMVQDGNLTISATPCDSLFAVQCVVLYARRQS